MKNQCFIDTCFIREAINDNVSVKLSGHPTNFIQFTLNCGIQMKSATFLAIIDCILTLENGGLHQTGLTFRRKKRFIIIFRY